MKGKIHIIAKFHRTDLVICSHSRERKPPSYSRRNTVNQNTVFIVLIRKTTAYSPVRSNSYIFYEKSGSLFS